MEYLVVGEESEEVYDAAEGHHLEEAHQPQQLDLGGISGGPELVLFL